MTSFSIDTWGGTELAVVDVDLSTYDRVESGFPTHYPLYASDRCIFNRLSSGFEMIIPAGIYETPDTGAPFTIHMNVAPTIKTFPFIPDEFSNFYLEYNISLDVRGFYSEFNVDVSSETYGKYLYAGFSHPFQGQDVFPFHWSGDMQRGGIDGSFGVPRYRAFYGRKYDTKNVSFVYNNVDNDYTPASSNINETFFAFNMVIGSYGNKIHPVDGYPYSYVNVGSDIILKVHSLKLVYFDRFATDTTRMNNFRGAIKNALQYWKQPSVNCDTHWYQQYVLDYFDI